MTDLEEDGVNVAVEERVQGGRVSIEKSIDGRD